MKSGGKVKCYCCSCIKTTNHTVKEVIKEPGSFEYQVDTFYGIVQCDGCDNISYLTKTVDYELMHYDDVERNDWVPTTSYNVYPETLKYHSEGVELYLLPRKIKIVYSEAVKAFSSKCYLLTAVAFRAIIEAVCMDKGIKVKEFEDLKPQIDKLNRGGFITKNEAERLHAIRFLGNDSVHEMTTTKEGDLFIVLNIIEHLLKNLYIIDQQIKETKLETIINNFDGFEELLNLKIDKLKAGESLSLKTILGKSARRLSDNTENLEVELIEKIKSGQFKKLSLGDLVPHQDNKRPPVQYYEVQKQ